MTQKESIFEKLESLSEHLRLLFKKHWMSETHLTVDESIQRFTGRAAKIVNIPSKSVCEGFKIWILASSSYVLDWMWHAKDDKKDPVDLDDFFLKDGFSKTQAIVLDLLSQQGIFNASKHIVWLDNLFTSARLLKELRERDFEGAGTVRTTKTQREIIEENDDFPKQKEQNHGLNFSLSELKLRYNAVLEWGKLYGCVSEDKQMISFAWKDQNVVLFMSTVSNGTKNVIRPRRRSAITSINARTSRAVFGEETVKELVISEFIDTYNHFMNGVDQADQLRSYYTTQRVHMKSWKALWHFLLDATIVNKYKIAVPSSTQGFSSIRKKSSHMRFRIDLATELFRRSERLKGKAPGPKKSLHHLVNSASAEAHEQATRLSGSLKACEACKAAKRVSTRWPKRKPLQELHPNNLRTNGRRNRIPRTFAGCALCNIHLCSHIQCWKEHLEAIWKV